MYPWAVSVIVSGLSTQPTSIQLVGFLHSGATHGPRTLSRPLHDDRRDSSSHHLEPGMNFIHCPPAAPRAEERWTHIYQPPPTRGDDVPDEHDVFETVAAAEEESLVYSNLNLCSKEIIMTATTTKTNGKTHTLPANPVINPSVAETIMPNYHSYFDPTDMVEDHLAIFPAVHARVMNSAAWMLDMACINAARNIVFTRYAESELDANTDNRFGTFCQGVAEMLSHDSFYDTTEDTPESVLATLLALSRNWHDATAAAYAADNKDYNPKGFDELLLSEKPRLADAGTRANYEVIAKHEARGDEAKQKRFMDAFLEADRLAAMNRSDDNKKLIPVLSMTLHTVGRYAPATARFDQLPHDTQRKLTAAVTKSFGRIKLDMAKVLARETILFGHVLEAMYQCTEALEKMLATKYTESGELEYAGMPASIEAQRRTAKAAAALRE